MHDHDYDDDGPGEVSIHGADPAFDQRRPEPTPRPRAMLPLEVVHAGPHPGAEAHTGSIHDDAEPFESKKELLDAIEGLDAFRKSMHAGSRFARRLSRSNLALFHDAADPVELSR